MTEPLGPSTRDVTAARDRDPEAFQRVYMASADRIHALARWLLGTPEVDDVVQDVYVRAWDRLPGLREPEAFAGWLRQLATNVILRRRERVARQDEREAPMPPQGPGATSPGPGAAPDGHPGLRLDLERALDRLPERARRVFVLYDVEGHRHQDIAALLGISHHTSRSQLHRARSLMKEFLMETEES